MVLLSQSPDITKILLWSNPRPCASACHRSDRMLGFTRAVKAVGVKKREAVASSIAEIASLNGQFSTPLKSRSRKDDEEDEERRNYYVNMGYAIRTLREDIPKLFCKELNFDIYREDIVFKDPMNCFIGMDNYKSIFWALRFHGKMFFRALSIDIVSVWQPMDNVILVRWTVHGIPRVPWESRGRFDGTSEYKFDKNGKIFQHKVDNIALNSPPKFRVLAVAEIISSIGCSSTPKPTYFEVTSTSADRD